jgi:hypothetical protein
MLELRFESTLEIFERRTEDRAHLGQAVLLTGIPGPLQEKRLTSVDAFADPLNVLGAVVKEMRDL